VTRWIAIKYRYELLVKREQPEGIKEKYPNLAKSPQRLPVVTFYSKRRLEELDDGQIRKFVENVLERKPDAVRDRDYQPVEEGYVMLFERGGGTVWGGEFETPPEIHRQNGQMSKETKKRRGVGR